MKNQLLLLVLILFSHSLLSQEFIQNYPTAGSRGVKITQPGNFFNILTQNKETNAWNVLNISESTGDIISIGQAVDNSLPRYLAHSFFYELDTLQNGADKDIQYSKYEPDGTLIWQRVLDLDLDNFGICVIPTDDDNLLLGGVTQVGSDTLQRIFLTKMTQGGDVLWHRIIPKSATQYDSILGYIIDLDDNSYPLKEPSLNKIYPTKDGGYLIRNNHGYNGGGVLTLNNNWIKTDEYGRVVWTNSIVVGSKNINNPVPSTGYTQLENGMADSWEDGSVVIAYNTKIGTSNWSNAPIVKYNPAGESVFMNSYDGHSWFNDNYGVAARPNGGVFHILFHGDLISNNIGLIRDVVTVFGFSPNVDGSSYLQDANYVLDLIGNGFINTTTQEYVSVNNFDIHDFQTLNDNKFIFSGAINSTQSSGNNNGLDSETPFVAVYDLTQECNTYEKDFSYFGEYEGHTYFLSDIAYSLSEMEGVAAEIGGSLVSINSKGEHEFLTEKALGNSVIIGLSDVETEGTFVWADGNPVNFTNNLTCLPECENSATNDYVTVNFNNGNWDITNNSGGDYRFIIEVNCEGATELLPDLMVKGSTVLPEFTTNGETIPFEVEVENKGSADQTGTFIVNAYLSLDKNYSADDYTVGTVEMGDLAMTNSAVANFDLTIPTDILSSFYYLIFVLDEGENVIESIETNNISFARYFYSAGVATTIEVASPGIDIRLSSLNFLSSEMTQGQENLRPIKISNYGNEDLTQPIKVGVYGKYGFPYLTTGEDILAGDLWGEYTINDLPAGTTDTIQVPVYISENAVYGSRPLLHFYADYDNQLEEVKEDNNFLRDSKVYNVTGDNYIDFDIQNIQNFPNTLMQGETFDVSFQIVNTGTLPADGDFLINIALVNDQWSSPLFGYDKNITLSNLAAGAVQNISTSLTVAPHTSLANDYQLRFEIDSDKNITEAIENNNTIMTLPANITAGSNPDLVLSNLTEISDTFTQGDAVSFYFDIENIGDETAVGNYNIKMYLHEFNFFSLENESDYFEVGSIEVNSTPVGVTPDIYGEIAIPEGFPVGDYYILIVVDANSDIDEKVEFNNYISKQIHIKSITDDFAWELECPEDIVVQAGNESAIVVNWDIEDINTANNCSEDLTIDVFGQSLGFCSGGLFPIGVDVIEYGISGFCFDTYAEASCQFTVTVQSHPTYIEEENVTLCAGESYEDTEYFTDTILSDTIVYTDFDSIFVTNIMVLETFDMTVNSSSCNPDEVGTFTELFTTQNGCDSLVTTEIIFSESAETNLTQELCSGENIIVNGTVYDMNNLSGTEIFPMGSVNGCDSLVNISINLLEDYNEDIEIDLVAGELYNDIQVFTDTIIVENYTAINGCDSTINVSIAIIVSTENINNEFVNLTIFPNPTTTNTVFVQLQTSNISEWNVQVFNTLGQRVFVGKNSTWTSGSTGQHQLEINSLERGTYFVSVENGGERLVEKLVIF